MNERIKELALQAGGSHYPDVGGKTLEKFALLIIRECARELDERTVFVRGVRAGTWIKNFMGIEE